jgi:CHAT domain-containing protein
LYDILLGPVASCIEGKEWLLVIPDADLWDVPFGALPDGDMHLVDKVTVQYAPSLTTYRLAWERRKINQQKGLLVGERLDGVIQDAMTESLQKPSIFLGQETTERFFKTNAPSADIIHLGRWIIPHEANPLTSSLVLSPGDGEDGFFRIQDWYSLDLRASLVILPSDGQGTHYRYAVPISFFHGLLYAGVPSVVIPMWRVDREVQSLFFKTFYRYLETMTVSEALSEAQCVLQDQFPEVRNET